MSRTASSLPAATATSRVPVRAITVLASALAAGALFGFGLSYSTMIRPDVVLSFLRFRDLGLLLVLGGAVVVTFVAYQFAPRLMRQPLFGGAFGQHESVMDRATIVGAAIFGIGWGLCGVCPGPAIAGLGAGSWELGYAIAGIALGALVQGLTARENAGAKA
jgi:uncharacterized membrane protein YedE/YeeE